EVRIRKTTVDNYPVIVKPAKAMVVPDMDPVAIPVPPYFRGRVESPVVGPRESPRVSFETAVIRNANITIDTPRPTEGHGRLLAIERPIVGEASCLHGRGSTHHRS